MMEKIQTQMLKDGKRTVIIINGAGKEQDELAYRIISAYYGTSTEVPTVAAPVPDTTVKQSDVQKTEPDLPWESKADPAVYAKVKDLEPAQEPVLSIPSEEELKQMEDYSIARSRNQFLISAGEYKGITALDALHRDDEVALVKLHKYATELRDCGERDEIITTCKQYMVSLPDLTQRFLTRQRKCEFIKTISKMASVIPFINGYMDMDAFISYAADAEVDTALVNLSMALADRGRN